MKIIRKIKVAVPEKLSTNKYNAKNKFNRNNIARQFHMSAKVSVLNQKIKGITKGSYPVSVFYEFYLRGKRLDWVNLGAMTKMIEDGLTRAGIFEDDDPKFISHGTMKSYQIKKDEMEYCMVSVIKKDL